MCLHYNPRGHYQFKQMSVITQLHVTRQQQTNPKNSKLQTTAIAPTSSRGKQPTDNRFSSPFPLRYEREDFLKNKPAHKKASGAPEMSCRLKISVFLAALRSLVVWTVQNWSRSAEQKRVGRPEIRRD